MDNAHLKKTWQKGVKALEQRDFARAITNLKKVEKAAPEDPDVHFALADALLGQGKVDQAIRQCRMGVDAAPEALPGVDPNGSSAAYGGQRRPSARDLHASSGSQSGSIRMLQRALPNPER